MSHLIGGSIILFDDTNSIFNTDLGQGGCEIKLTTVISCVCCEEKVRNITP
jgi:hypothetical protein